VIGDVFSGGLLDQQMVSLSVEAEATHLPDGVDVDVEGMEIGTQVLAGQLTLPSGTTLAGDPEALVLHVLAPPTEAQLEEELGETAEADEAGAGAEDVPPPVAEAADEASE
jgi:large subunit ribosomal protein L25